MKEDQLAKIEKKSAGYPALLYDGELEAPSLKQAQANPSPTPMIVPGLLVTCSIRHGSRGRVGWDKPLYTSRSGIAGQGASSVTGVCIVPQFILYRSQSARGVSSS